MNHVYLVLKVGDSREIIVKDARNNILEKVAFTWRQGNMAIEEAFKKVTQYRANAVEPILA